MRRLLIVLPLVGLIIATDALAVTASVTLNQPSPVYGDTVNFTMVYPKAAQGNGRTPQFPDQPNLQMSCYQNGVTQVALEGAVTVKATKINLGGGWFSAQSSPIILDGGSGYTWPPGPASCQVTMYSVEQQNGQPVFTTWAWMEFQVAGP